MYVLLAFPILEGTMVETLLIVSMFLGGMGVGMLLMGGIMVWALATEDTGCCQVEVDTDA